MEFPVDSLQALIAFLISVVGATLQGSIGFGLGLIGVPLLVLINPVFVPGPLLLAALMLTLLIAGREHRHIDFHNLTWPILGRLVGSLIGAAVLSVIPRTSLGILFGTMVLIAVLLSIIGPELRQSALNLFGAGTVSGVMATTASIGGAPMALMFQRHEGPRIRGTLSSIFIFGTLIAIGSLISIGRFGWTEIQAAAILAPGTLIGFLFSKKTSKLLDKGYMRPVVLIASALSGLAVILKNIL